MSWKTASVDILSRLIRPGASAACAGAFLSGLLKLVSPRKAVALWNLERVLPGSSAQERKELLARTYEHIVWTGLEFVALQRDPTQALQWVEEENAELLDRLNADKKGAILLTAHVGNWELAASWGAQRGYKMTAIIRESPDEAERGMIEQMRLRAGVTSLPKNAPMTRAIGILKRGEFLGILPDQHGGNEGIPAQFFGVQTQSSQGAAVFAYLTKKPLIPIYIRRIEPFRHKLRIGEPIEWTPKASRDETILDITTKINAEVERMVLEAPGQWLAQHRRFKGHYSA